MITSNVRHNITQNDAVIIAKAEDIKERDIHMLYYRLKLEIRYDRGV